MNQQGKRFYKSGMPGIDQLSLYDVFALPFYDAIETQCRLCDLVCDRHYFMYWDSAGNEQRIPWGAPWPEDYETLPIWTKDHEHQIVEWTNVDPADFSWPNAEDNSWTNEVGGGWARVRAREPGARIE